MTPRSDEQVDREMDKLWDRVDAMGLQLATLIQQNASIESAIKTMAESTGKAMSNLTVCAERGVKLEDAKERITRLEAQAVDRNEFNATVKTLRDQVSSLKGLLIWVGALLGSPLAYLVIKQMWGE
jgi:septal ring factor EnvC (AmiA/AmiB activator)